MADTPRRFDIVPPQALLVWLPAVAATGVAAVALAIGARHGQVQVVAVLPAIAIMVALIATSVLRQRVELVGPTLRVASGLLWTRANVADIDVAGARILDLDAEPQWRPRSRTRGTSMPGLRAGKFRLRGGRRGFVLLTDTRRVLLLPKRDGTVLLLSLQQPQALLDALSRVAARDLQA